MSAGETSHRDNFIGSGERAQLRLFGKGRQSLRAEVALTGTTHVARWPSLREGSCAAKRVLRLRTGANGRTTASADVSCFLLSAGRRL
jgi:hypothetical protein